MSAARGRKRASNSSGVAAPIRPYYSTAVHVNAGPLLFVSGQLGADKDGRLVGDGNVTAEAEQALKNIQTVVEEHGGTMSDVVKVTVYVTDLAYLDEIAPVRLRYFPTGGPASVIVQVGALALGAKVEIEAIVAV
jgi:reactive intermediate/imine deaminase